MPTSRQYPYLKPLLQFARIALVLLLLWLLWQVVQPYDDGVQQQQLSIWQAVTAIDKVISQHWLWAVPFLALLFLVNYLLHRIKQQSAELPALCGQKQKGEFGSAEFATPQDLKRLNAYDPDNGLFVGADSKGRALYLPLMNKLTLSPPGGGKTSSSSIPALLSYEGPVFALDVKGELWAVTARYRSEKLKRKVIAIDPFKVTQTPTFSTGKNEALVKLRTINPLDFVPTEPQLRDRVLNAVAASLVIAEGGYSSHFDDNAKILIRGTIDYLMQQSSSMRTLPELYRALTASKDAADRIFTDMATFGGRAAAAAHQIMRVGMDERGSILSTTYRQIDWLGDSNMSALLSAKDVDLRDFLKGDTDIFVILPEDQVKEHGRLMRMLMALLMGLLVQANPKALPQKKMLFLLDEVAQLGTSPDVEQCIEVLRARGVVVWTVFQTLSQIEAFAKPDLFKGAPLKQFFTNDDADTMEWIQLLAGKKTIVTQTLSTNSGDSRQTMQFMSGTKSTGDGKSLQETGVDLIQLNEIRELSHQSQWLFLHGEKPIQCQKVRYFEHPFFKGRFDKNPLEGG